MLSHRGGAFSVALCWLTVLIVLGYNAFAESPAIRSLDAKEMRDVAIGADPPAVNCDSGWFETPCTDYEQNCTGKPQAQCTGNCWHCNNTDNDRKKCLPAKPWTVKTCTQQPPVLTGCGYYRFNATCQWEAGACICKSTDPIEEYPCIQDVAIFITRTCTTVNP